MDYKIKTVIYELDDYKNSLREQNTFTPLLTYRLISSSRKSYSNDNQINVFELTKEDMPGSTPLVETINGKSSIRVLIDNMDGTKSLNPMLSIEKDDAVWGVIRVVDRDDEVSYMKVERDRLPDDIRNQLPDYVDIDAFKDKGEATGYKIFAYNQAMMSNDKNGLKTAKAGVSPGMAILGGALLVGVLKGKQDQSGSVVPVARRVRGYDNTNTDTHDGYSEEIDPSESYFASKRRRFFGNTSM